MSRLSLVDQARLAPGEPEADRMVRDIRFWHEADQFDGAVWRQPPTLSGTAHPGLEINMLFRKVRDDVRSKTGGKRPGLLRKIHLVISHPAAFPAGVSP